MSGRTPLARSLAVALMMLAATVAVLGAVEIVLLAAARNLGPGTFGYAAVAAVYLGAGTLGWWRRPSNRIGPLALAGAVLWLAGGLVNTAPPALVAVGAVTQTAVIALVAHLLLAYPSGRLPDRASRWTAAAVWFVCLVLQAPLYLFGTRLGDALVVADRPDLAELGETVQALAGTTTVAVTTVLLSRRLRRADRLQQRVLAPLYLYGVLAIFAIPLTSYLLPRVGFTPEAVNVVQLLVLAGVPVAFVGGILRGGFARTGEVEELASWLSAAGARPELTATLARALGDDSLELVFWVPERSGYVDADGRAATLPAADSLRAVAEVELAGRRVGAIVYDATLTAEPDVVRAAGRVMALAMDRERLTAELRASQGALRRSRARIVDAADRERRKIARDLHDGLQVRLVLLALDAQEVAKVAGEPAIALRAGIDAAAAELRGLVHAVMPAALVERGLSAATEDLVDRMPLPTRLELGVTDRTLPPAVESTAYFVVAEGLANALKHARAHRLVVRLEHAENRLCVEVHDDGVGGAERGAGSGLRGLADRVDTLGGHLDVHSVAGQGTRLLVELPCGS